MLVSREFRLRIVHKSCYCINHVTAISYCCAVSPTIREGRLQQEERRGVAACGGHHIQEPAHTNHIISYICIIIRCRLEAYYIAYKMR